jgi:hypothetical protein
MDIAGDDLEPEHLRTRRGTRGGQGMQRTHHLQALRPVRGVIASASSSLTQGLWHESFHDAGGALGRRDWCPLVGQGLMSGTPGESVGEALHGVGAVLGQTIEAQTGKRRASGASQILSCPGSGSI